MFQIGLIIVNKGVRKKKGDPKKKDSRRQSTILINTLRRFQSVSFMFLLYHRKLQFGKKLFLVFLFGGEDAEDEEEEGEDDQEEKPKRADDDDFLNISIDPFKINIENHSKNPD